MNYRVEDYLERIGYCGPVRTDIECLAALQASHLRSVPFENLGIHLDEAISLDEDCLFDKIVRRRRGGLCFELNGAFAALLREIGFAVTLHPASVFEGEASSRAFSHVALVVDLGRPWLVDVGFGAGPAGPLRLDCPSPDVQTAPDGDLDVFAGGRPLYRLEARPRELADFEAMCLWQQASPDSRFRRATICTMATTTGRVTLSNDRLIVTSEGSRSDTRLQDDASLLDAYRRHFGIELCLAPRVASASAR